MGAHSDNKKETERKGKVEHWEKTKDKQKKVCGISSGRHGAPNMLS